MALCVSIGWNGVSTQTLWEQPISLEKLHAVSYVLIKMSSTRNRYLEYLPTFQKDFHNEECKKMVYRPFGNTGLHTSVLGFGGAQLALCDDNVKEQEGIETVIAALKSGINYIDTAPYYGQGKAENVLGKALKFVPRNSYYLATKVGRYGHDISDMFDFSAERTFKSVEESLCKLGVDYFDVLQVHDIEFAPNIDVIINETLPAMQKIKDMGKAKFIGITGYPLNKLKEVIDKSSIQIDAVLSYCRCTLFDDSLLTYIPFFKEKKMAIVNAASLGMGLLTHQGPPEWHPAGQKIKDACFKVAKYCKDQNVNVSKLAFSHSLSQSEDINVHLVGMESKEKLRLNLEFLWNGLSDHELAVKKEMLMIFKNLEETHWENVELNKFRKAGLHAA